MNKFPNAHKKLVSIYKDYHNFSSKKSIIPTIIRLHIALHQQEAKNNFHLVSRFLPNDFHDQLFSDIIDDICIGNMVKLYWNDKQLNMFSKRFVQVAFLQYFYLPLVNNKRPNIFPFKTQYAW